MKNNSLVNVLMFFVMFLSIISYEIHLHAKYYNFFQIGILIISILAFFLVLKNSNNRKIFQSALSKQFPLAVMSILMVASSFITTIKYDYNGLISIITTILYIINSVVFFILMPLYIESNKNLKRLFYRTIIVVVFCISIFGIALHFRNGLLGYYLESGRSGSIFFDPNYFSVIACMPIILCLDIDFKNSSKFILIIISILALLYSGSRGTMVGLLLSVLFYIFSKSTHKVTLKNFIVTFLLACTLITFVIYLDNNNFWRTFQGTNGREKLFTFAIEKISNAPVFGYGYSSVKHLLQEENYGNATTHNAILDNTLKYGIPCNIFYIYIIIKSLYYSAIKNKKVYVAMLQIFLVFNMNTILFSFGGVGFPSIFLTYALGLSYVGGYYEKNKYNYSSI